MIKKQTVWLLTMLSLMIVLSVYYITSDPTGDGDFAYIDNGQTNSEETALTNSTDDNDDSVESTEESDGNLHEITNVGRDELFTTIRMELQNERSMKKSRYQDIVASSTTTTEEKNEALNQI